ncbi:uncharacterized protein EV154DRAFT_539067 [Mucor mucedo]|uniref:uncharacterized protein n=1 Tax=Mucor mucedo TaxID=29922 RepID=UPI00221FB456|nr:uncharacterized protein EV154DRAFT_539067 [Mucor mucedo]KAI7888927.1 hypothetical protein EV154DRAFT_539067 [Mucor mucedo]
MMADYDKAMNCYESALRHNSYSVPALTQIASLCRGREQFGRAIEYFKRILGIQENNGDIWAALGHCYLMMDNLQDAYGAYQQALYHLPNPKDPKLWYGIGILYDRYGSLEHAEEAFSAVMKMDPHFEKSDEIYFRLGIIYKQQRKYDLSLQCFRYILHHPPRPLTESDIWFQTGHVYEQKKEYNAAKESYEHVLRENTEHAKVLQQLGWLYHQQGTNFRNGTLAMQFLNRSLKADSNDAQTWYLLGRCSMAEENYNKAYESYQQAVYRDSRNPTFWCSIGVLYYQINQYRDALDAYSKAIRLNPYISEVWYNLGTLYETCNNQVQDALDAYQRASDLDPANSHIKQRLELLKKPNAGGATNTAPVPQDVVNPSQYNNSNTSVSGGALPFDQYQNRTRPSEHRDITEPGRDLPMLASLHQRETVHHHIPDIEANTRLSTSSSSPPPARQSSHMSPMQLSTGESKGEEPRSPQPSSIVLEKRVNGEDDDDMPDVESASMPPLSGSPGEEDQEMEHENDD